MGKKFDYDLIVIGSGVAGSNAAESVAKTGRKVAIVESTTWGGSRLNDTDVPYGSMLHFSHLYTSAREGIRFGLSTQTLRYNYPTALNWQLVAKRRAGAADASHFKKAGIDCFNGHAYFISPNEISIASDEKDAQGDRKEKRISASKFLIATGATPSDGGVSGIDQVRCYTPAEALRLRRLPKAVFIVGAGATGCELAEYYASLGVNVLIADLADRILPKEDFEVSEIVSTYFREHFKIKVLPASRVVAVSEDAASKKVHFITEAKEHFVRVQAVILATGSKPNLDFAPENANIKLSKSGGISVDRYLETSARHIYAAGDVISGNCSSERAAYEGLIAAKNILRRGQAPAMPSLRVSVVDTNPEVISVGKTEDDCIARDMKYEKIFLPLSSVPAANTTDSHVGFVKLIADRQKNLIGASIICPHATMLIGELSLAIKNHISVSELAMTPHFSANFGELIRLAARELAKKK